MPTGHGIRVEKPRSAKQRESAMKYLESQPKIQPSTIAPSESWWLRPRTRAEFDEAVVKEAPRMQGQPGRRRVEDPMPEDARALHCQHVKRRPYYPERSVGDESDYQSECTKCGAILRDRPNTHA